MVALAGRKHSWHTAPRRVARRENFLPRGTLAGVQQRTTRSLGSGSKGSQTGRAMTLAAMKMTDQTRKAEHFRSLHVPGKTLLLLNIWDAGGAKVVTAAGAKAIATSSWSVANSNGFSDGEQTPPNPSDRKSPPDRCRNAPAGNHRSGKRLRRCAGRCRRNDCSGHRSRRGRLQPRRQLSDERKTPRDGQSVRAPSKRSAGGRSSRYSFLRQRPY